MPFQPFRLCTCLLASLFTITNQPTFPISPYSLYRNLSFHRRLSIGLLFNIHQFHRPTRFSIFCPAALVVRGNAVFRVGGPAGVIRSIRTFDDVAIAGHIGYNHANHKGERLLPLQPFLFRTFHNRAKEHVTEFIAKRL